MKKFSGDKILLVILILAFILRVWGIWWGLPLFLHLDEPTIISPVLKMIQTGDLNPHYFRYPTLYIYFIFFIASVSRTILGNVSVGTGQEYLYLIGRFSTALMSTITVYLTYWLAKSLFSKKVGYFAAVSFSIMFLPIYLSHFITVDILALLLLMLSLVFCFKVMLEGKLSSYLLAGLFSGLLIGTKFNIVVLVPLFLSYLFSNKRNEKHSFLYLVSAFLISGLFFLITNPYFILSFQEYTKGLISQILLLRGQEVVSMSDQDGIPSWLWYLKYWVSSGIGLPLSLAVILGILLNIFKKEMYNKKNFWLFVSFPLFYIPIIFLSHHRTDRYSLPLMPFFAIFAGLFFIDGLAFFEKVIRFSKMRLILSGLFISIFIGLPIYKAIAFDYLISQKDTRQQTSDWLKETYPKDQTIFAIGDTMHIGHYLQKNGFDNVINAYPLESQDIFLYSGEVLLIDSTNYHIAKNYLKVESYKKFWENYQLIKAKGKLIQEFSQPLFKAEFFSPAFLEHSSTVNAYHNPTVEIYKIPELPGFPEKEIKFEYFPEAMKKIGTNMELVEEKDRQRLYAGGDQEASTAGPYEIFPKGDYLLQYFLEDLRCNSPGVVFTLQVTSAGGGREFASRKVSCWQLEKYNRLTLNFQLKNASLLELKMTVSKGASFFVEKALLTREAF